MYMGHVGVALAAKRAQPGIALLVLLFATYAPDWLDGGLCLVSVHGSNAMLSHSFPAVVVLAVIGFSVYGASSRDWKGALLVAGLILSHMVLDWLTGLKPTWPGGPWMGLELYDKPVADFGIEAIAISLGALLYSQTLPSRSRRYAWLMAASLIVFQVGIAIVHFLLPSLPKC